MRLRLVDVAAGDEAIGSPRPPPRRPADQARAEAQPGRLVVLRAPVLRLPAAGGPARGPPPAAGRAARRRRRARDRRATRRRVRRSQAMTQSWRARRSNRQALVVAGERRQSFQRVAKVVGEVPGEPSDERRRVGVRQFRSRQPRPASSLASSCRAAANGSAPGRRLHRATATGSAVRYVQRAFRPGRALSRRTRPGRSRNDSATSIAREEATSGRATRRTPAGEDPSRDGIAPRGTPARGADHRAIIGATR